LRACEPTAATKTLAPTIFDDLRGLSGDARFTDLNTSIRQQIDARAAGRSPSGK
jgi:hypothetical protein